jgi:hypothetical protein
MAQAHPSNRPGLPMRWTQAELGPVRQHSTPTKLVAPLRSTREALSRSNAWSNRKLLGSARALPKVRFAKANLSWAGPSLLVWYDCFLSVSRSDARGSSAWCEHEAVDSCQVTHIIDPCGWFLHQWEVSTTFSPPIKLKCIDCVFSLHHVLRAWEVSFFLFISVYMFSLVSYVSFTLFSFHFLFLFSFILDV